MSRYWIGVAAGEHVRKGVAGGFAQLGHGKHAPVQKLIAGDWIDYYSPRNKMKCGDAVQAFTAIGRVKAREAYQVSQEKGFRPFRRDVAYRRSAKPATMAELREELSFTKDRGSHCGMAFRRGGFERRLRPNCQENEGPAATVGKSCCTGDRQYRLG
ncbi:MAG: EVE domain-containing protein [Candidatus Sulfotelmatobacter sp.]